MNFVLLLLFFGAFALGSVALRVRSRDRRLAAAVGVAAVALLAATGLFFSGNRRDEMDAIPLLVLGGLVFWGAFVPSLAAAVLLRVQGRGASEQPSDAPPG